MESGSSSSIILLHLRAHFLQQRGFSSSSKMSECATMKFGGGVHVIFLRGPAFPAVTVPHCALHLKYQKLIKLRLLHGEYHLLHFNQLKATHLASFSENFSPEHQELGENMPPDFCLSNSHSGTVHKPWVRFSVPWHVSTAGVLQGLGAILGGLWFHI